MQRVLSLFLVLCLAVILFLGASQEDADFNAFVKDSVLYETLKRKHDEDSARIRATRTSDSLIGVRKTVVTSENAASGAYMNAAQGIEVHLAGLEWRGQDVSLKFPEMQKKFRARFVRKIDKISFDPDYPSTGYPDLDIAVQKVEMFHMGRFSQFLREQEPKPVKSFELETSTGKKARMQLWLVSFDLTFQVIPDDKYKREENLEFDDPHPITHEDASELARRDEMINQRYSQMTVMLEFKPKAGTWFIGDMGPNGVLVKDSEPQIGIAAVECSEITKIGEDGNNNRDERIGIVINQGKALSLYPDLAALKQAVGIDSPTVGSVSQSADEYMAIEKAAGGNVVINPSLFNKSKFSAIEIQNLGSWKERRNWFLGPKEFGADYFKASFLVHLYVFGEWTVKPSAFVKFEARKPFSVKKPGLIDRLLPDFTLGAFGKIISIALIALGIFAAINIFSSNAKDDTVIELIAPQASCSQEHRSHPPCVNM